MVGSGDWVLGLGRRSKESSGEVRTAPQIDANLAGAVISGQVAIGEHIVQIHAEHGAIVNYQPPTARPVPRARQTPIRRLPRAFDLLVGREQLLGELHGSLAHGGPAELVGEPGIGKTSVLRNVSHHLAELQPHGVVYTAAREQPADDLLQFLFESFYDCGGDIVLATAEELSRYLGDRRALIVLDDAELDRDELERVMDLVAGSTFLTASSSRRVWGEGRSFEVHGLDEPAAIALLERELGRPLGADQRARAAQWCRELRGSPLRILQLGGLMRAGVDVSEAFAAGSHGQPGAALERLLAGELSDADRRVIAPLAAVPGTPVPVGVIAATSGVGDAPERLVALEREHVVQSHSPRYTLAPDLGPGLIATREGDRAGAEQVAAARAELVAAIADAEHPAAGGSPGEPEPEVLLALIRDADARGATGEVLALAHAGDRVLGLSGRWGAWRLALDAGLRAATAAGATAQEAWARHQLGSRALGLGDRETAARQLRRALELRESLGDHDGAAVTRHNLDVLFGPPPPPPPPPDGPGPRWPLIVAGALLLALAAGVGIAVGLSGGNSATPNPTTSSSTSTPPTSSTSTTTTSTSSPTHTTSTSTSSSSTPAGPPLSFDPSPVIVPVVVVREHFVKGGRSVSVSNTSPAAVNVESVDFGGEPGYQAVVPSCLQPLPSGASCTLSITVAAVTPPSPTATMTLTLTGLAPATVSVALCQPAPPSGGTSANPGTASSPGTGTTGTGTTGGGTTSSSSSTTSTYQPC